MPDLPPHPSSSLLFVFSHQAPLCAAVSLVFSPHVSITVCFYALGVSVYAFVCSGGSGKEFVRSVPGFAFVASETGQRLSFALTLSPAKPEGKKERVIWLVYISTGLLFSSLPSHLASPSAALTLHLSPFVD